MFEYFLSEYKANRTPNPDILCNQEIKFKAFLEYALKIGADVIATGHYAGINQTSDSLYSLYKGMDENKDQSYFLHRLNQYQLKHSLFPLADYAKPKIRQIALEQGFITHNKKDSTGICFIGEKRFNEFLSQYLIAVPGEIKTPEGKIVGKHNGLMYYTIGQRKGIGIGGQADNEGGAWYVADKRAADNTLIVVQGHDHPLLFKSSLECNQLHWISGSAPTFPLNCKAKTRYRQVDQACTVLLDATTNQVHVDFEQPQRAITPGQSVVFYRDNICLGGGVIC